MNIVINLFIGWKEVYREGEMESDKVGIYTFYEFRVKMRKKGVSVEKCGEVIFKCSGSFFGWSLMCMCGRLEYEGFGAG